MPPTSAPSPCGARRTRRWGSGAWKRGPKNPVGVISLCMGFTLVDSWNCPYKPVLPHIGITWGLLWLAHETAHENHCFFTHWHCMGFTLVDSWNCPCNVKRLSCHTLELHGSTRLAHEVAHVKPLFCYSLVLHGAFCFSLNVLHADGVSWTSILGSVEVIVLLKML